MPEVQYQEGRQGVVSRGSDRGKIGEVASACCASNAGPGAGASTDEAAPPAGTAGRAGGIIEKRPRSTSPTSAHSTPGTTAAKVA